ncbi:hypothetical protein BH11GEM2_BH11GEM2_17870 [soil metagenome]
MPARVAERADRLIARLLALDWKLEELFERGTLVGIA